MDGKAIEDAIAGVMLLLVAVAIVCAVTELTYR